MIQSDLCLILQQMGVMRLISVLPIQSFTSSQQNMFSDEAATLVPVKGVKFKMGSVIRVYALVFFCTLTISRKWHIPVAIFNTLESLYVSLLDNSNGSIILHNISFVFQASLQCIDQSNTIMK